MAKRGLVAAVVLALMAACGSGDDAGSAGDHDHSHEHDHAAADEFAFGSPGDADSATQTVEITAADPNSFEPETVEVEAGETVTFVVTNDGEQPHEFVLGDAGYQESHAAEMMEGEMHHDEGDGNAVSLDPGETAELTWTFPSDGEVLYGCHVAGHYEAGMVGTVTVGA